MQKAGSLEMLENEKTLVFTAIANPEQFRSMLIAKGILVSQMMFYPDHYTYPRKTLEEIAAKCKEIGCNYILTTEKDLVKIDAGYFADFQLLAIRLSGSLNNTDQFLNKLRQFIDIKI